SGAGRGRARIERVTGQAVELPRGRGRPDDRHRHVVRRGLVEGADVEEREREHQHQRGREHERDRLRRGCGVRHQLSFLGRAKPATESAGRVVDGMRRTLGVPCRPSRPWSPRPSPQWRGEPSTAATSWRFDLPRHYTTLVTKAGCAGLPRQRREYNIRMGTTRSPWRTRLIAGAGGAASLAAGGVRGARVVPWLWKRAGTQERSH